MSCSIPAWSRRPRRTPAGRTATAVCVLETTLGTMAFELFADDAPKTVAQFKALVRQGFYDGKDFYRVVRGHVIQAGTEGPAAAAAGVQHASASLRDAGSGTGRRRVERRFRDLRLRRAAAPPRRALHGLRPDRRGRRRPRAIAAVPVEEQVGRAGQQWPCTSPSSRSSSAAPASITGGLEAVPDRDVEGVGGADVGDHLALGPDRRRQEDPGLSRISAGRRG